MEKCKSKKKSLPFISQKKLPYSSGIFQIKNIIRVIFLAYLRIPVLVTRLNNQNGVYNYTVHSKVIPVFVLRSSSVSPSRTACSLQQKRLFIRV